LSYWRTVKVFVPVQETEIDAIGADGVSEDVILDMVDIHGEELNKARGMWDDDDLESLPRKAHPVTATATATATQAAAAAAVDVLAFDFTPAYSFDVEVDGSAGSTYYEDLVYAHSLVDFQPRIYDQARSAAHVRFDTRAQATRVLQ
jgi:hypothetical protein